MNSHLNVLIVEDESIVAMEIDSYISKVGCRVTAVASSAKEVYTAIKKEIPDLILMDIYLEGDTDGIEAASIVKKKYPQIEIIFLSANKDVYNIDRAIDVEPLSYLGKPFNRQELLASLKMAKNKIMKDTVKTEQTSEEYLSLDHEFKYDLKNKMLYHHDTLVHLTKKEAQLLTLFIEDRNTVIDVYILETKIWSGDYVNSNTVRSLIRRLRTKLKHRFIETLSSQGYIFNTQENKDEDQ